MSPLHSRYHPPRGIPREAGVGEAVARARGRARARGAGSFLKTSLILLLLIAHIHTSYANHETFKVDNEFKQQPQSFEETNLVKISDPTDVEISPDGKLMLVTNKLGKLWVIENFETAKNNNDITKTEALDIASQLCTNGERGLGGVAFHPKFGEANRWIYLYYTYEKDSGCYAEGKVGSGPVNRLSRFTLTKSNKVDEDEEVVYFETPRLPRNHHNSGDIAFGKDGYLYVTVGDGGTRTDENKNGVPYAQALDKMMGKIVRLTDMGDIPEDNPYTPANGYDKSARCSDTGGEAKSPYIQCQEIYASGLRNPWRFAHDPNYDGVRFFVNDVGRKTWERILEGGEQQMGANYGYPEREGPCLATEEKNCKPDAKYNDAIHWYKHDKEDGGAVTGAAFYPNDAGWPASFLGSYLYADYARGGIFRVKEQGDGCSYPSCDPPISNYDASKQIFSGMKKVVSMRFGPYKAGTALYVVSRGDTGNRGVEGVFRIAYTGVAPAISAPVHTRPSSTTTRNKAPIAKATASPSYGFAPLRVDFSALALDFDPNDSLTYEWDVDGDGNSDGGTPSLTHTYTSAGKYTAALTVKDGRGGKDKVTVMIEVANTPPTPLIEIPEEGATFSVGEKLKFEGSATDKEGDDMPTLTWEIRLHHEDHFHQIMPPTKGKKVKLKEAPNAIDLASVETSYLLVRLTATDSAGLSTTVERIMNPEITQLQLDTEPSGLVVTANTDTFTTPATIKTWKNQVVSIEANKYQALDGVDYAYKEWNDGGKRTHEVVASSDESLRNPLVATFRRTSPFVDIGSPADGSSFAIGDTLSLSGDASDISGNPLPDSLLTWEVRLHHDSDDSIYETLLNPTHGRFVEEPILDPERLVSTSEPYRLEVILTATDPTGATSRKSIILRPRQVDIVFNTSPIQGLYLRLDGERHQTPVMITTWESHKIAVEAPSQTMDDMTYVWESWSDGGEQSHDFVALPHMITNSHGRPHEVVANFRPPVSLWSDATTTSAPSTKGEKPKRRGIGMIVISGIIFAVVAVVCVLKLKAKGRRSERARKRLSFSSADLVTEEGTPQKSPRGSPIGSPTGSIHGIDDNFVENEQVRRGSLDFGDPDFAQFGTTDADKKPSPIMVALSVMRGDIV